MCVIIQLMPPPFSQGWVRNIRKLAKANWWDGMSINRVQDNYVVQWGDPAGDGEDRKPLPDGLEMMTEGDYTIQPKYFRRYVGSRGKHKDDSSPPLKYVSLNGQYAGFNGFGSGWAIAGTVSDSKSVSKNFHKVGWKFIKPEQIWPIHCYGALGVGRGLSPDTGSGAELYTVIGHAPRHLDRNIAVVGRIIEGMHHLSSLPRGFGPLGFYETPEERVPIQSIRLVSELTEAQQPRFEYLSTEGGSFAQYAHRRANREPPFFILPAGGADICNIPVPVRRVNAEK